MDEQHLAGCQEDAVASLVPWRFPSRDAPTVQWSLMFSAHSESDGTVQIALSLDRPHDVPLFVPIGAETTWLEDEFQYGHEQQRFVDGLDFALMASSVVFAPGETEKAVSVSFTDDSLEESTEALLLTIGPVPGAIVGPRNVVTVLIQDDDATDDTAPSLVYLGLTAPALRCDSVDLSWQFAHEESGSGIRGAEIYANERLVGSVPWPARRMHVDFVALGERPAALDVVAVDWADNRAPAQRIVIPVRECDASAADNACLAELEARDGLAGYASLLRDNPELLVVTYLCERPASFREAVWQGLADAERTSMPPHLEVPGSFDSSSGLLSNADAEAIDAAHLARVLWVEKNALVPWRLSDYDRTELERLFVTGFGVFRSRSSIKGVLDHSPRESWEIANRSVDLLTAPDQETALRQIYATARAFVHVTGEGYFPTLADMDALKISARGCYTMSSFIVDLAKALNIPGESRSFTLGSGGHSGAFFPLANQVLLHGDHIYGYGLENPGTDVLWRYDSWKDYMGQFPSVSAVAARNARAFVIDMHTRYNASPNSFARFCQSGSDLEERTAYLMGDIFREGFERPLECLLRVGALRLNGGC